MSVAHETIARQAGVRDATARRQWRPHARVTANRANVSKQVTWDYAIVIVRKDANTSCAE